MPDQPIHALAPAGDWGDVEHSLNAYGHGALGPLLTPQTCAELIAGYDAAERYRSHIDMARYGFGSGEYKYFTYPLPDPIARLRSALYPPLAAIANRWRAALGEANRFPDTLEAMIKRCHQAGQTRPTPLILKYSEGDYNCLHQDLYGEHVFGLQVVILLSDPGDFAGGELVLTEQRPRQQSRAEVVPLHQGHGVVFAVNERPRQGTRGVRRVRMRHGVSRLHRGTRYTLGVIFHDAA